MKTSHTYILGKQLLTTDRGLSSILRVQKVLSIPQGKIQELTQAYTELGHKLVILNDVCKGETTREVETRMPKYL